MNNDLSSVYEEISSQPAASTSLQDVAAEAGVTPSIPEPTQQPNSQGNPDDVAKALNYVGNTDMNQHQGMCEQFVEQVTGAPFATSAMEAWNNYSQNGLARQGTQGLKPGDIMYFSPNASNEGNGHTGIYMGDNKFISATDNGVQPYDLSDWQNLTGQSILGYVPQGRN